MSKSSPKLSVSSRLYASIFKLFRASSQEAALNPSVAASTSSN
jgi:hypothetical protein